MRGITAAIARGLALTVTAPRTVLCLAWLLLLVGVALLVGAGIALQWPDQYKSEPPAAAAAVIAIAAVLFTLSQQLADKAEARSLFYLDEYRKGYDIAFKVLESAGEGDSLIRIKWITAARILETARRIADKITESAHRDVVLMDLPHQSERFQQFFDRPAEYYYGGNPSELIPLYPDSLNEAARRATRADRGTGDPIGIVRSVPESVLNTVWQAIQYPRAYSDPIGGRFEDGDLHSLPRGARNYVDHTHEYRSILGKLYRRGDEAAREIPPELPARPAL